MPVVDVGDVGKRLRKAREAIRPVVPKQGWLARELGVSQSRLSNWEKGKHDPPRDLVDRAAEILGIKDTDRYFYSEKEMPPQVLGLPMFPVGFSPPELPYAGIVPAGDWGDPLASEEMIPMEYIKFVAPGRFVAQVVGNSCYPSLRQGDMTIWQSDKNPSYGLIVIAQRKGDHGCTVKELAYDEKGHRPVLMPINPDVEKPLDDEGWGCIARLIGVTRNIDGMEHNWYLPSGLRRHHLPS